MIERINRRRNVDLIKNNSPKMRIFSLSKINSVPEAQEEEIKEEEECGTMSINNNNINNMFDFIVFTT